MAKGHNMFPMSKDATTHHTKKKGKNIYLLEVDACSAQLHSHLSGGVGRAALHKRSTYYCTSILNQASTVTSPNSRSLHTLCFSLTNTLAPFCSRSRGTEASLVGCADEASETASGSTAAHFSRNGRRGEERRGRDVLCRRIRQRFLFGRVRCTDGRGRSDDKRDPRRIRWKAQHSLCAFHRGN